MHQSRQRAAFSATLAAAGKNGARWPGRDLETRMHALHTTWHGEESQIDRLECSARFLFQLLRGHFMKTFFKVVKRVTKYCRVGLAFLTTEHRFDKILDLCYIIRRVTPPNNFNHMNMNIFCPLKQFKFSKIQINSNSKYFYSNVTKLFHVCLRHLKLVNII